MKQDKKLSESYNELGLGWLTEVDSKELRKKDFEKAISSFERAVKLDPENMQAYHNLGVCNFRYAKTLDKPEQRAMLKEARQAYEKAHELNPDHPMLNADLGACYVRLKEYEKAIEYPRKAQELGVSSGWVNNDLSYALAQQREIDCDGELEDLILGDKKIENLEPKLRELKIDLEERKEMSKELHIPLHFRRVRTLVEDLGIDPNLVNESNYQAVNSYIEQLEYTPPDERGDTEKIRKNILELLEGEQ